MSDAPLRALDVIVTAGVWLRVKICAVLSLLLLPLLALADSGPNTEPTANATAEIGLPTLENFSSRDYGADPQNWAIVQDPRGVIYVGNGDGVLAFAGSRWQLIKLADRSMTARSLAMDAAGRIYVGAVGEIGYLDADARGRTRFVSLLSQLPLPLRGFGEVEQTFVTPLGVVFVSQQLLLRYHNGAFESWSTNSAFRQADQVGEQVLVREVGRGLLALTGKELKLLPKGERFADEALSTVLALPDQSTAGTMLVGSQTQGFLLFDGARFSPWPTAIDAELQRGLPYRAVRMADGGIAVGTSNSGLYLLDAKGRLQTHINRAKGLPDDTVWAMASDRDGGLWLGLSRGLSRLQPGKRLSQFNERSGLEGTVRAVQRHLGRLYVGTHQGLFELQTEPHGGFHRVPGVDRQIRDFASIDDTLLLANYFGVYALREGRASLILPAISSWTIIRSSVQPARVFVGLSDGLAYLDRAGDGWHPAVRVAGIRGQIRSIYEDSTGALWLGTRADGVIRVRFDDIADGNQSTQIERFGINEGLPNLSWNVVFALDGALGLTTEANGVYRFNPAAQRFEPDPRFAGLFAPARALLSRHFQPGRGLWLATEALDSGLKEVGLAALNGNSLHRWQAQPLAALIGADITALQSDPDGVVWLGGEDGLFRYDPRINEDYAQPFNTLLQQVSDGAGNVLYGGNGAAPELKLAYGAGPLRFEYAAASFDDLRANRFQVMLEGKDADWSKFSAENYRDYGDLREGDYRFRVRAKNLHGTLGTEATIRVQVQPPWRRTALAYLAYIVLGVLLGWAVLRIRVRRLRARKQMLERTVAERTLALAAANTALQRANAQIERASLTDPLTELRNRRGFIEWMQSPDRARAAARTALVLIDIDHFKAVNDSHGHAAGDTLLKAFADVLRAHCDDRCKVARWGGEEFLLEVPVKDETAALIIGQRLVAAVATHHFVMPAGSSLRCTCSIGIACLPLTPADPKALGWEQVLAVADAALYLAKRSGRNRAVCLAAGASLAAELGRTATPDWQQQIDIGALKPLQ